MRAYLTFGLILVMPVWFMLVADMTKWAMTNESQLVSTSGNIAYDTITTERVHGTYHGRGGSGPIQYPLGWESNTAINLSSGKSFSFQQWTSTLNDHLYDLRNSLLTASDIVIYYRNDDKGPIFEPFRIVADGKIVYDRWDRLRYAAPPLVLILVFGLGLLWLWSFLKYIVDFLRQTPERNGRSYYE